MFELYLRPLKIGFDCLEQDLIDKTWI